MKFWSYFPTRNIRRTDYVSFDVGQYWEGQVHTHLFYRQLRSRVESLELLITIYIIAEKSMTPPLYISLDANNFDYSGYFFKSSSDFGKISGSALSNVAYKKMCT